MNFRSGRLAMPRYSAVAIYNQTSSCITAIIVKMHEKRRLFFFHRGSSVTHIGAVMTHTLCRYTNEPCIIFRIQIRCFWIRTEKDTEMSRAR